MIVVTSDPRRSPKPAEAVRIAAGISAGGGVNVSICFCGDSVLALGEAGEELIDGGSFSRYLPLLLETGGELLALKDSRLRESAISAVHFDAIETKQLASKTSGCKSVLRF
jgi:hypothetical protein